MKNIEIVIYIAGFIIAMIVFIPRLVESWWGAQGDDTPFELQGAVWVVIAGTFLSAGWPLALPVFTIGWSLQRFINRNYKDEA